jgi:hypothetical protein
MPIYVHEGETLKNASFLVSEHIFRNCKLVNCNLFYDSGTFEWVNTSFENCHWNFRGAAGLTVQLLMTLGLMKPGQIAPQNIQSGSAQVH